MGVVFSNRINFTEDLSFRRNVYIRGIYCYAHVEEYRSENKMGIRSIRRK